MALERLSRSEIDAYKRQNESFLSLGELVDVDAATLSPQEYSELLSRFRALPTYILLDPLVAAPLSAVLTRANEIRIENERMGINQSPRMLTEFYDEYLTDLPEVICLEPGNTYLETRYYRVPKPFFPHVIERIANLHIKEPFTEYSLKSLRRHSVSLGSLIREANVRRIQAGLKPLPAAGSALGAFFDAAVAGGQLQEIYVVNRHTYRNLLVRFQDRDAVIETLINTKIESWRSEDEQRAYFSSGFATILAEFTGQENPVFDDIFSSAYIFIEKIIRGKIRPEDQPDLVNSIIQKLIPHLDGRAGTFKSAKKLKSFISTVCRTGIADYYRARSKNRTSQFCDGSYQEDHCQPRRKSEEHLLLSENGNEIELAVILAELTPGQRRVLELKMQGLPLSEIAILLSQEEGKIVLTNAVKSRLHRTRNRIRKLIKEDK